MSTERFNCNCGHRLALHTYFKDRTPCTLCGCASFSTEATVAADGRSKRPRRSTEYTSTTAARTEAERRPV